MTVGGPVGARLGHAGAVAGRGSRGPTTEASGTEKDAVVAGQAPAAAASAAGTGAGGGGAYAAGAFGTRLGS